MNVEKPSHAWLIQAACCFGSPFFNLCCQHKLDRDSNDSKETHLLNDTLDSWLRNVREPGGVGYGCNEICRI
jgi:hypothetical protein